MSDSIQCSWNGGRNPVRYYLAVQTFFFSSQMRNLFSMIDLKRSIVMPALIIQLVCHPHPARVVRNGWKWHVICFNHHVKWIVRQYINVFEIIVISSLISYSGDISSGLKETSHPILISGIVSLLILTTWQKSFVVDVNL